jgi:hypothetical protein
MEEQKCRKLMDGRDVGLAMLLESWSGNSAEDICDLRGRDDAKHMVKVTNLEIFPLDVACTGQILSDPRKAKFRCRATPSVSENQWIAETKEIEADGGYYCFDHVSLCCTRVSGFEKVHTKLRCMWLDKSRNAPPLTFDITT